MNMILKVKKTIDRHRMLDNGDTVIVALSGGVDSCALLSVMTALQKEYNLKIVIAHFNHGLRGEESDFEESFCRNLALKFRLPFESATMKSISVPKGESPEGYYRKERYHFLDKVAREYEAKKIALGHHLSDQAETVLLNILRGSGIEGLKGILPVRDHRYIRPMIDISRKDILDYMEKKALKYCNDSSNYCSTFLRNRVRLELLPLLREKYNPQIEQGLARMAQTVRRDHECLEANVREIMNSDKIEKKDDFVALSINYLNKLPEAVGFRLVKSLLENMAGEESGIYYSHIQAVVHLAQESFTGKTISLPFGLTAAKEYDNILIKKYKRADIRYYQYSLSVPDTIDLKEKGIIISTRIGRIEEVDFSQKRSIYLDLDAIKGTLILRNRRFGDWFIPLGTSGRQKIKKLLIDHKIPRSERDNVLMLADDISVLWIENMHLCDRVKITPATSRVLVLNIR